MDITRNLAFTDCQLRAMRSAFDNARFTEVLTPALELASVKDHQALETRLAGQVFSLAISPDPWLERCLSVRDRVFAISKAFREESINEERLAEFHYAQFWMYATLADAMSFLELVFWTTANELSTGLTLAGSSMQAPQLSIPFPRLTYRDAALSIGKTSADKLDRNDYLKLCAAHGSPIFLVRFPPEHEPRLVDAVRLNEGTEELLVNFELITPFAGEVGNGREVQATDSRSAAVCAGVGLERMAQFFLSTASIADASSLPPTTARILGAGQGRG